MDCSPLGSSVHGILQARTLQWVDISFSSGYSWPRNWTWSPALPADSLPTELQGKLCYAKSLQSRPTLCDPIDGSPPGSPVPGVLQARTLEWVAISFSNAWKWKVKSEKWKWNRSVVSDPQWPHGLQPSRLLRPWDFPGKSTGVGYHCLLHSYAYSQRHILHTVYTIYVYSLLSIYTYRLHFIYAYNCNSLYLTRKWPFSYTYHTVWYEI